MSPVHAPHRPGTDPLQSARPLSPASPSTVIRAVPARSGLRPSFSTAAAPADAERVFGELVAYCRQQHTNAVETGRFGAHMVVSLVNDGPVTFLLRA